MKLEVGKTYLTRSGLSITIINRCNTERYPFVGVNGKSQYYFSECGKFSENTNDFDLVSPLFNVSNASEVISFVVSNETLNDMELKRFLKAVAV